MKNCVSKKRMIITAIISAVSAVIVVLALLLVFMGRFVNSYLKISEMDLLVRNYFYGDLSEADFDTALCNGYISQLDDDYAEYMPSADAKENFDSFDGKEMGIGITIAVHPDTYAFHIINVSTNSPAYKAGLKSGDVIVSVSGIGINKENYVDKYHDLKGEIGDVLDITVERDGVSLSFSVTIESFEVQSVFWEQINDYGYIQITDFNSLTVKQFKNAINTLVSDGAKGLIFDVRGNGGGTLDSVAEMLDFILPKGDIVYIEYADGGKKVLHRSDSSEIDLPMTVLTDKNTASASELFAASIRDYEKGVLIGQTTYGKGVMQKNFKLHDGSAVRFTSAKFFSKGGKNYNGVGIEPDYMIALTDHEKKYLGVLSNREDPYIKKAVEYLNENR